MLGTLFLTLGLAAAVAATLRAERRDRVLLWFGLATALYGLRLIARSETVRAVTPLPGSVWDATADTLTYLILIPGSLLAAAALAAPGRGALKYLWRANAAAAIVEIVWDLAAGRAGAAMDLNRAVVVLNIALALALVAGDVRAHRFTNEAWLMLTGVAVFAAAALAETIAGDSLFDPFDAEPFAMLALVGCLGYVVVRHVFWSERRMAAVGRELETARRIQQSILPKDVPAVPGLSVATHYESMSEVAGDIFDFVVTPSGQLGVLVADVSGHGVPAALVASMVKIALAVQEGEVADPGMVLNRMNRALCGRFELAYVTAVFAFIDPAAGTVRYASAGHPSPMLIRRGARIESLDERGMVLGFLPDATYTSSLVRGLAPGDRIVFHTDGITEAEQSGGEFYGDRQFRARLAAGHAQPAPAFVDALVTEARGWVSAPFADDVTVVVVDWT